MWALNPGHYWFSQGCQIGCPVCTGGEGETPDPPSGTTCPNPIEPLIINGSLRSYPDIVYPLLNKSIDIYKYNPWRAPGWAPILDPCGVNGGYNFTNFSHFHLGNGGSPPPGSGGVRGSTLPPTKLTTWKAGGTAEVAWTPLANHGGGYQYRLCPKGATLDEECFQKMPLFPVGNTSWIRFGPTSPLFPNQMKEIAAARVSKALSGINVNPAGSVWTKGPIPGCGGTRGGADGACNSDEGGGLPMFPPPIKGLYGFGMAGCLLGDSAFTLYNGCTRQEWFNLLAHFDFDIVDRVRVPAGLKGEYVLSWRWDSEQTSQVWANCADLKIE